MPHRLVVCLRAALLRGHSETPRGALNWSKNPKLDLRFPPPFSRHLKTPPGVRALGPASSTTLTPTPSAGHASGAQSSRWRVDGGGFIKPKPQSRTPSRRPSCRPRSRREPSRPPSPTAGTTSSTCSWSARTRPPQQWRCAPNGEFYYVDKLTALARGETIAPSQRRRGASLRNEAPRGCGIL